jgi:putative phage-type endonuclease
MLQKIIPASKEEWLSLRKGNINSTEVAALFACSPYTTAFELWHRKKDDVEVEFDMNDRVKWGMRLETAIAEGVAEENKWKVRKIEEYMWDDSFKLGASFDFEIEVLNSDGSFGKGILEVKNVDSLIAKQNWLINDDGSVEAPPHIEIQVQTQLAVSGLSFAYIAALVGGNRIFLIKRTPDARVIEAIKAKVAGFWASIAKNNPPAPDFAQDAEFIGKLYGYAEVGKILDASQDETINRLAKAHREASLMEKEAKERKDAAKAELLTLIGDSEKVLCNGYSITAGMVGPAHIEFDREGYRNFRINWPRAKKEKV